MRDETSSVHLTSDRVAAFLDGSLSGVDRERAVRHLAECADCRSEVTELRTVLDSARNVRPRRWIAAAAGVAAILAFAVVPRLIRDDLTTQGAGVPTDVVRAADGDAPLSILSPTDSASLPRAGLTLMWQSVGTGVEYSVVVLDTAGASIWSTRLTDTTATLPDTARLYPGLSYYWKVDARLADGRSAKTGANQFTIQ